MVASKEMTKCFGVALLVGLGLTAMPLSADTIYYEYTAIDSISGDTITASGAFTGASLGGGEYSLTSSTGTRSDGAETEATELQYGFGDYYDHENSEDHLLYDTGNFADEGGISVQDVVGDNLWVDLVTRSDTEAATDYTEEPYFEVSTLGLYEDVYSDPRISGDSHSAFYLNPITSVELSDTPFSSTPEPGTLALLAAGVTLLGFRRRILKRRSAVAQPMELAID
jgi:hypothetical protein